MSTPLESAPPPIEPFVDALLGSPPHPVNQELEQRIVVGAQNNQDLWRPTKLAGLSINILEYFADEYPRMTALLKIDPNAANAGHEGISIPSNGLELLVEHGMVADDTSEYLHPFYIRQPQEPQGNNSTFTLFPGSQRQQPGGNQLEFYVATGQLEASDKQKRCINLTDHSLWLPGPVENTEVMPLHMHNGNNSMLVRWLAEASFKTKLDPLGEEVLVIGGTLADKYGTYSAGSWIRNPVTAWQAWGGSAGTIIYYKNGHFGPVQT